MASEELRRFETLIEINALINSQYKDVRLLLSRIMESAERLIGSDASSLLLVDRGTGRLYFEIALGTKGDTVKQYTLKTGEGIAGWVVKNNRSLIVNDTENDKRHFSLIGEDTGYHTKNLIAVPLRVKDQVIGVLEAINKTGGSCFNDDDRRFLEVLADQASIAIQNARDFHSLNTEIAGLRRRISDSESSGPGRIIWKSPVTGKILAEADKMARSNSSLLILGESGTGKELFAERAHAESPRSQGPMIKVNCAAIPAELIESELFGYIKGAFTDALRDRSGYFERASGGTLFLDEVVELKASVQGKLLRVLEDGRFTRVGGETEVSVDVRIIAAANRSLIEAVEAGDFRRDLYYRLAVLTLELPGLRDRPEDIKVLARHFLNMNRLEHPQSPKDFSLDALEVLLSYQWPGNVRELQNTVERALISARGREIITSADIRLGTELHADSSYRGKTLKDSVTLFKKNYIREVLKANSGNQTAAARSLGIQRTYLSRIIKDLAIADEEP